MIEKLENRFGLQIDFNGSNSNREYFLKYTYWSKDEHWVTGTIEKECNWLSDLNFSNLE